MPEIILNAAGITRTTGTANPTITGDTGKSGSFSYIPDGTEIAYYRRYSSNKPGFENCTGIWRAVAAAGSIGYIERGSVEKSSNGGSAVVWGVGEQIIDVTITPDMIVADDDPRLDTVAVGELGADATTDGTETWIAEKGGEGVDLNAEQVLGDPVHQKRGHKRIYRKDYCDFHKVPASFFGTNGGQCGAEPWLSRFSGTGALVATAKSLTLNGLILTTGTDTNGYAVIEHLQSPSLFNFGYSMETVFKGGFNNANLPTVEAQTAQIGFVTIPTALATAGFYFEATEASPNWQAVVRANASNVTKKDTGVAYAQDFTPRFKPVFDALNLRFLFYINETLVATTLNSERIVPALTSLYMAAQIRKSAGSTTAGLFVSDHSYKIQTAELVGF